MSNDKRKLIRNYFDQYEFDYPILKNVAKYGIVLLFIGVLILYFEQIGLIGNFKIISIILILAGLFSFWILIKPFFSSSKLFSSKAADGDLDVWFLEDLHEIIKPRAIDQLRINPSSLKEENIIIIPFPVYWKNASVRSENITRKMGSDGSYVYSVWQVQVLIVTENYVSYYSCLFDWVNTILSDEKTNEYFFDDISSVSNDTLETEYKFIDNENNLIGIANIFMLTNMSGDKLKIITDIPGLNVPEGYSNNLERLVQAIRILLRNRRYGEEIERSEKEEIIEVIDNNVEFEVNEFKEQESKVYFHQLLREIYNDYNIEND